MPIQTISVEAVTRLAEGFGCCWKGCNANYKAKMGDRMPEGWRALLVFWEDGPTHSLADIPPSTWDRDALLCPAHAAMLATFLVDIPREPLAVDAQGTA